MDEPKLTFVSDLDVRFSLNLSQRSTLRQISRFPFIPFVFIILFLVRESKTIALLKDISLSDYLCFFFNFVFLLSVTSSLQPLESTLYDKKYANYSKVGHCGQGRLP